MPRYSYAAKDVGGVTYKGIIQASGKQEVRHRLRQRGFYATSVKTMREGRLLKTLKGVGKNEVAIFAEQLAVMVESGLTLPKCIETVLQQIDNQKLARILDQVKRDIEKGVSFSEALGKHPKTFSKLFVSMVRAGEIGGTLAKSLRQLADYLDNEQQTKLKVKSALAYPKIVAGVSVIVIVVMLTFIVPRFISIYASVGIRLPLTTRILLESGRFIARYWWVILLAVAIFILGLNRLRATKRGKNLLDRIKLNIPIFGDLNRKVMISRFIRILSTLISSGVSIMESLGVVEQVVDNSNMDRVIDGIRTNISSGGGLKEPIAASNLFPPMVVQMIGVGEETGRISELLEKSSGYLDREVDATVKRLIARVEPSLTVIVAAIVGLIAMSIYFPLFDLVSSLK